MLAKFIPKLDHGLPPAAVPALASEEEEEEEEEPPCDAEDPEELVSRAVALALSSEGAADAPFHSS